MDLTCFHERADDLLTALLDAIEAADGSDSIEADLVDEVLTIELDDGREYVISKHEPTMQIWLSSPASGASHFSYDESDDEWRNSRDENFKEKITDELANVADIDIEF